VEAVADYFPTLDPKQHPFVVLDLAALNHYGNRHNRRLVGGSNELWASLNGDPQALLDGMKARGLQVKESYLAADLVSQRVEQPLANAGWGGLLVLMFLALVLANASGVVLFSYMDTRERQTEFALLRTLGSSKNQLNGVAWFTLFLVVVCGIGLGTWAGQQIGASLLPVLEVSEGGVRVTPPMLLQTNWATLLVSYLVLAAVSIGTVVWLAWLTARMEVHQVLRAGEAGV
jgi:predicted lysophospholipase L1 biosynthesis ABC-type transport system permease subunit